MKLIPVIHQFSLFDFNTMRPKKKVPMKKQSIIEAKAALMCGDPKKCAAILREIRYRLEAFEARH